MNYAINIKKGCPKDIVHIWSHLCWRRDRKICYDYTCRNWECNNCHQKFPKDYVKKPEGKYPTNDEFDIGL